MVDYSKVHEVIAETNEGILLAEYQPEYRTDREFQSEADLERTAMILWRMKNTSSIFWGPTPPPAFTPSMTTCCPPSGPAGSTS